MNSAEIIRRNRLRNPQLRKQRIDSIPSRLKKIKDKSEDADSQVIGHMMGEPSEAFYPENPSNIIIFDRHKTKRSEVRKRHEETEACAKNELMQLARKQEAENTQRIHFVSGNTPEQIFSSYMRTSVFHQTSHDIRKAAAIGGNYDEISKMALGKIFEDITFGLLSHASTKDSVLLSPNKSYIFTKALYPRGKSVENVLEQNFIRDNHRAYVPDGYSVSTKTGLIEFVLEYTLNPYKETMHSQIRRFKETKKRFPEIFSANTMFILVTQKSGELEELDDRSDIKILKTPFTGRDIGNAFGNLWRPR